MTQPPLSSCQILVSPPSHCSPWLQILASPPSHSSPRLQILACPPHYFSPRLQILSFPPHYFSPRLLLLTKGRVPKKNVKMWSLHRACEDPDIHPCRHLQQSQFRPTLDLRSLTANTAIVVTSGLGLNLRNWKTPTHRVRMSALILREPCTWSQNLLT